MSEKQEECTATILERMADFGKVFADAAQGSSLSQSSGSNGSGAMASSDSPIWSRHYSLDTDEQDCQLLNDVLSQTGAERMVVAHTVQQTINPACNEKVWRVDVGMAAHYGGATQVLEIIDGKTTIITE